MSPDLSREEKALLARVMEACDDDEQDVIEMLERMQESVESRPWVMA